MKIPARESKEKTCIYFSADKSASSCFQVAVLRQSRRCCPAREKQLQSQGVALSKDILGEIAASGRWMCENAYSCGYRK